MTEPDDETLMSARRADDETRLAERRLDERTRSSERRSDDATMRGAGRTQPSPRRADASAEETIVQRRRDETRIAGGRADTPRTAAAPGIRADHAVYVPRRGDATPSVTRAPVPPPIAVARPERSRRRSRGRGALVAVVAGAALLAAVAGLIIMLSIGGGMS